MQTHKSPEIGQVIQEWIKNLKIAQKLHVLLTLASVIALIIGVTGYFYVQKDTDCYFLLKHNYKSLLFQID